MKRILTLCVTILLLMITSSVVFAEITEISQLNKNYTGFTSGDTWLVKVDVPLGTINSFEFGAVNATALTGKILMYSDDQGKPGVLLSEKIFSTASQTEYRIDNLEMEVTSPGAIWIGVQSDVKFKPIAAKGTTLPKMQTDFGIYTGNYCIYFTINRKPILLSEPTDIVISADDHSVLVDWSDVTDAEYYNVYRAIDTSNFELIASKVPSSEYVDNDIKYGVEHHYKIEAENELNKSEISQVESIFVDFTLDTLPDLDEIAQTDNNYTNFTIGDTWLVKQDFTIGKINNFSFQTVGLSSLSGKIQLYKDNSGSPGELVGEKAFEESQTNDYFIDNLDFGVLEAGTYWIGVQADEKFKPLAGSLTTYPYLLTDWKTYTGNYCIYFKINDGQRSTPKRPESLSASIQSDSISLNWGSVDNADGYIVYRSTSASAFFEQLTELSTTEYIDASVEKGVTYYYKVAATNSNGQSEDSNMVSAVIQDDQQISAPTNLKASVISGKISLSWDSVANATSYRVLRSETVDGNFSVLESNCQTTDYLDGNAQENTLYYYKVIAQYNDESSGDSNVVSASIETSSDSLAQVLIILENGDRLEYFVTSNIASEFEKWYIHYDDTRDDKAYEFVQDSQIGPFMSRGSFVIHSQVQYFEINIFKK